MLCGVCCDGEERGVLRQILINSARNSRQSDTTWRYITSYEHPLIFVMSRRTGETYRFLVGEDGALVNDGTRFDLGDLRRKAIEYLYKDAERRKPTECLR